ncbi:MAG: protein translocase subunit SecD [Planctomycetota bacterium]|jgi:SecD/SecF fusion protein
MNAKNLPLKLAFVGLLLALCLWSLFFGNGIQQGIDLRGGYSLIFEIRTNEMERKKLEVENRELIRQLSATEDEQEKKVLRRKIEGLERLIERYRDVGEDPGDLAVDMITVLKNRFDESGLAGMEWRPIGKNRIEVRVRAGSKEAQAARKAYYRELEALEGGNLNHGKVRKLIEAPDDQKTELIATLAHDDPAQVDRLRKLVASYRRMLQAQEKLQKATTRQTEALIELDKAAEGTPQYEEAKKKADQAQDEAETAQRELKEAHGQHEDDRKDALERGRISRDTVERDVLAFYVSPREAHASEKRTHKEEVGRRRELFKKNLAELLRGYPPSRKAQLEKVVEAYKRWWDQRRYLDDPADLKRLIAKTGVLEFRIVPYLQRASNEFFVPNGEYKEYERFLKTLGPEEVKKRSGKYIWLPVLVEPKGSEYLGLPVVRHVDGRHYMLVYNQEQFMMLHERPPAGWRLTDARPTIDSMGRPAVAFKFDEKGASIFARLTDAHKAEGEKLGHAMAIVLDDIVYSAPVIKTRISKEGEITGRFTNEEVADLVRTLKAGSLPAKLNPNPVAENNFGPAIGEVNRERGLWAGMWGLIAVAGFMILYYRLPGLIAVVALVLNMVLVLGAVSLSSAVLTLPGIAGLILTIGIAVDANVLIFERLREEQAKGQSVRMTLKNAYERAFSAIFDANVTTLIVCLILGWVGSEEVRGFAITLTLGVVFSMFTALVVTRWIFQLLLDLRIIKRPPSMARIIGTPKVNWMSKRVLFWVISIVLMVMGIASLTWQGGDILGIEFTSGTQAVVKLKQDALLKDPSSGETKLPDDGLVRELFIAQARGGGTTESEQLVATARVEKRITPDKVRNFLKDHDANSDGTVDKSEFKGNKEFFELIDNGDGALSREELDARLPESEYQVSTTVSGDVGVGLIRETIDKAFGTALKTRQPCRFSFATSKRGGPDELDDQATGRLKAFASLVRHSGKEVEVGGDKVKLTGTARVDESVIERAAPIFRYELKDFEDGGLLVFRDVEPVISETELRDRIRDMQGQVDFSGNRFDPFKVIGLEAAEGKSSEFTSFAVLARPARPLDPRQADNFIGSWKKLLGLALMRSEAGETRSFDAAIAGEMKQRAILAIILSWGAIVLYLWFRFGSVQWGVSAVVCLVHDVIIVVGLVAASGWLHKMFLGQVLGIESFKLDLAMIAAVLTVIGYSVNDSIVVFDRIRENRGKLASVSPDVINRSVNQTLSRTLLTSGTTLVVLGIMYVWGGPGIHPFSYALLVGVLFGTYSSVAVASPLLLGFRRALVGRFVSRSPKQEG